MADVVRSGAIFRVRDAATPNRRSSSSPSAGEAAARPPTRVRRVVVSALEAASSVDTSRAQSTSARRRSGGADGATLLPETPVGMPKRKARLQQTPNLRKKLSVRGTVTERTPEEIEASFNQLVMNVTLRKKNNSSARRASSNSNSSTTTPRHARSQSVSSSAPSSTSPVGIASATSSRVTRSAMKARLAPSASPASSVQTQVLESTEEEDEGDDAAEDKTPPTKRKTTQAKRPRAADEPPSTSVRSSKRLRAQQRFLPSLPPAHAPIAQVGNTEEDEELLQIQKRLVFGKSRNPKVSIKEQQKKKQQQHTGSGSAGDSTAEEEDGDGDDTGGDESAERVRALRSSPRRRSDQKQRLSASFSILEDVEALPKAKKTSSSVQKETKTSSSKTSKRAAKSSSATKIVLCHWTPQWPPAYKQPGSSSSGRKQKNLIQLVFEGQVEGRDAMVQFAKRVSAFEFVSTANERVKLDGALDVEMSRARGVPKAVVEILVEGVPINWRQKLGAVVNKTTLKRKKTAKYMGELETESEEEEEIESPRTKRSRSGRMITPVMDWWRGERLKTDVNGVTIVDHGSPAYISSPPKKAKHAAASSSKPPRTPVAPKTPVKAKTPNAKAKQRNKDLKEFDALDWTEQQLQALATAKMQIPTTATNFWAEVATFVDGKTANECRTKSFEEFASPTSRAAHKKKTSEATASSAAVGPGSTIKIPTKVHRAGSNLFKKQVRQFVQQYEKKHVDDLFDNTTPSKSELAGTMGLDDIKSPAAPLDNSASLDDDEGEDFVGGRELLQEISSNKRDEVDSYVLSLKRSRVLGEPGTATKASVRASFLTPSTLKNKSKSMKRAVHMYEAVGSHHIEGVVSPGGTTHVRINKDSDATSDEEDARDSDDENSDDDVF